MITTLTSRKVIRALTVEELPLCAPFGEAFHREKGVPGDFAIAHFLKNWTAFLTQYHGIILGLWEEDRLIGGLGGIVVPDLTSGIVTATEFFWYVDPAHRHGSWPIRLLHEFRAWGKSQEAQRLRLALMIEPGEDPFALRLDHLYRKLGLRPVEVGYDGLIEKEDAQ